MIVGKLTVLLGLDSKGFTTGINSATGKTTLFAKATDKTFKAIGKAAKIGMLAVAAAFVKGTVDAAKFEKALANVSTMLDKKTMPMMKTFEKGMLNLSEAYGESTDTLAKGLYDILSASIPAAQAMDVLETSAQAARAGLTDTGVAADAITTLMNSFGDASKDANYYSDILFSTVKLGKTTFGELAPVIGNVAKLMDVAGGTAEDMAGMLSIMTRNGIDTRVAVTSLRGVVSALIKPSEALTNELGGMTVKADGFRAVMDKIGSLPATDLAKMFPNIRALSGVVIAAKDLGTEVEKINGLMADGSPTMIALEKQTNTLAFMWDQFKKTLSATSIAIGNELMPMMKEILTDTTQWLKDNREGFAKFAKTTLEGIKKLVNTIFNLKEIILGAGTAILGLMVLSKIIPLMKSLGIATSVSLGPISAIAIAVGLLIGAFFKLRSEMRKLEDQETLVDNAMKGNLRSSEDYNDAIDIQQQKIQGIIATYMKQQDAISSRSEVRGRDSELAAKAHQERLAEARKELTVIVGNADKFIKVEEEKRKILEAEELEKQQIFYDEQARIAASNASDAEKAALKRQLVAEEKQRLEDLAAAEEKAAQDKIDLAQSVADVQMRENLKIDEMLWQASASESDRIERRRGELEELGRSYEDIARILKIEFPEAAAEAAEGMDMFWDREMEHMGTFTEKVDEVVLTWQEKWTEAVNAVSEVFNLLYSSMTGTVNQYFTNMFAKLKTEEAAKTKKTSKERKQVEKLYKDEIISEEEYQKQIDAIDAQVAEDEKKAAKKRYELEKQQFNVSKGMNIAQALMNTAQAVTQALTVAMPFGAILAGIVGALGAVQVGFIASQQPPPAPAFIRGGLVDNMIAGGVVRGNPGIDTNNIAVTNREYVMPPQQTADNLEELEAMRSGEGGGGVVINPMPLSINIEGKSIFDATIEFFTDESDLGSYRINPKVLGATT